MIKKQKNNYLQLEKTLTYFGLGLIAIGIFASLYVTSRNVQYLYDVWDISYYYRYLIVLGGGLLLGILVSLRTSRTKQAQLFTGVSYAILTLAIYQLFDIARLLFFDPVLHLQYPWGKVFFSGAPVLALIITTIIALLVERTSKQLSKPVQLIIPGSFIVYQIYTYAQTFYLLNNKEADLSNVTSPIWVTVASYAANPLIITVIAYLLLHKVTNWKTRLFYSTFIGFIAMYLLYILWEFNMDPTVEASNIFGTIIAAIVAAVSAVMIWRARAAVK